MITLQTELFSFAEEAFEIGHSFVNLRNHVNRECGTPWSLIRNLFCTIDYQAFVLAVEELKKKVETLRENVDSYAAPPDDAELEFYRRLRSHVDSLLKATNLTLRKFRCMAKKAKSARSGPLWQEWQEIVREEPILMQECEASGKALTRYYHQFKTNIF